MTGVELVGVGFAVMIGAILLRVPIAPAVAIVGFAGIWMLTGSPSAPLAQLNTLSYETFASYSLAIVPMFLLMGQFATRAGLSSALFEAASDWLGHRRGGLAMAAVGACAGFGAICGSSLATASTMSQVAIPEMRKRGYSVGLAAGVMAAAGTLGILIPPSIVLVVYAVLTQQNIAKMFIAALIPGIIAAIGYLITVAIYVRVNPKSANVVPRVPIAARLKNLRRVVPVLLIFLLVIGGTAGDWNWFQPGTQALFTPTEGAAVGAVATGVYGMLISGGMGWRDLRDSILDTAKTSAAIFLIVLAAQFFTSFVALSQAPQMLTNWVLAQGFSPYGVLWVMIGIYLVLGCVMEGLSIILLTIPIFYPLIMALDFGLTPEQTAIWFGILVLMVTEIGLITPPVGMNLFVINSVYPEIRLVQMYAGVLPFTISDIFRTTLMVAFPGLTLWLVGAMF